ncbi:uncharacterized protein RAG0_05732 [Rhynchosporium agropyri]|uniref:Zn(2)-C6 fungal-type domain-containing protein n=1 Tax=Rhynchosporium agropyri TaxID=914238 RepID=A0A1E1KEE5_9HELO|nr:uncharacterized protein RAG0_05732 [Rhynchosporium agropyri]
MAQLQTSMHPPCMSSSESFHKTELDARFVGWAPGPEKEVLNTAPRLHQKKSRTGCQQYRARRVKCNEVHPMCGSCVRHKTQPRIPLNNRVEVRNGDGPPEPSQRRLTELKYSVTCMTLNFPDDHRQQNGCGIAIPHLAFKHNSLLYSKYALHLVKLEPNNPEHVATYQRYLSHTLREHRDEVNSLNRSNADAACITLFYLRVCTFALLQERPLTPYTPPTDWLQMSRTTGRGLNIEAWNIFNTNNSIMCSMIPSAPGSVQLAIAAGEAPASILRRLVLFPTMVQNELLFLVNEQKPRALVIIAHFSAFLADFRRVWWLGDTGPREARGNERMVPSGMVEFDGVAFASH